MRGDILTAEQRMENFFDDAQAAFERVIRSAQKGIGKPPNARSIDSNRSSAVSRSPVPDRR